MPLLSDRESFDRLACRRAYAAEDSRKANSGRGFTILEACDAADYPYPVSENDLRGFCRMTDTWGIKVNVEQEQWFKDLL